MNRNEYVSQQFVSLRGEINGQQSRVFWILVIGLLGVPVLSYFLLDASNRGWILLPFIMLVLIVLYLAQQSRLSRAGRYVRECLEKDVDFLPGWETWLESQSGLRVVDRHFSACFLVVFFTYYFVCIGLALYQLWLDAAGDPSGTYWGAFFGAVGVYTITTVWGLATLFQHWKSSTSAAPGARTP